MTQVNLFNKHDQRGPWGIVKDFFQIGIWQYLSDVLTVGAICQDVLYSEGMSTVVACWRIIFSEKMNVGKVGMPNQQSIYYDLTFSDKGVFSWYDVNCGMNFVEFIIWV